MQKASALVVLLPSTAYVGGTRPASNFGDAIRGPAAALTTHVRTGDDEAPRPRRAQLNVVRHLQHDTGLGNFR